MKTRESIEEFLRGAMPNIIGVFGNENWIVGAWRGDKEGHSRYYVMIEEDYEKHYEDANVTIDKGVVLIGGYQFELKDLVDPHRIKHFSLTAEADEIVKGGECPICESKLHKSGRKKFCPICEIVY